MSKFLKSNSAKVVLGLVAFAFAFSGAASASAASMYTYTSPTLKMGSRGTQVMNLQKDLNACSDTMIATGAGSPGYETSYFGQKTKTAVMTWQAKMDLTSDGLFGPASRAKMHTNGCGANASTPGTGSLPAGCQPGMLFSPLNGAQCVPGGTTNPNQTGPVTAMLATTNPTSGTLVAGQATADLAHFTFSGTGTVTNVTLQRIGVSADSTPSNVYLFDGAMRLTDAASVSNNGMVTFNIPAGIFTVSGMKTISVKADIASGTSGQTVGMALASFATAAGTTNANLSGNVHTVASATLAGITAGTVSPTGAIINPGANITLWQSTLTVSTRDVWMKRVAFRNVGSAPASAFQNFKLYVNGVQVATALGMDANGYVTFDMASTPVALVAGSRVVRVDADVVSGASRTVQLSLRQAADVDFVDSSFGVNISPTSTPWAPSAASTIAGTSGGTLTIEKDVSSPSTNLVLGGTDVNLGTFKVTAYGEPMKIENLRATFETDDADVDSLRNGRLLVNGVQYGSTSTLMEDSSTPAYTQYTLNYTVYPGTPVMVELHADIFDFDGTNDLGGTESITGQIEIGSSNVMRVDSLGTLTAPAATVSANALIVATTAATLTKNATYASQSVDLPSSNFKIGSWNLTGSSVEDILLTTLSFDVNTSVGTTFDHDDITNMSVVLKNSSGAILAQTTPLATVGAADNNFSINYTLAKSQNVMIELYGNLGTGVTSTHAVMTDLTVTATSLVSGTAPTISADVAGQVITYGTASITASTDASSPVSDIVYDNQTVESAAFKFDAVTSGYTVTELNLTLTATGSAVAQTVSLYDGNTLVASRSGGSTAVSFTGLNWNIPANTNKVLTVKLQLGSIGSGILSKADLTTAISSFRASNTSTGVSAVGTGTPTGVARYAFAAVPRITTLGGDTLLRNGSKNLLKFQIDALGGTVSWGQLYFDVTKDTGTYISTSTTAGVSLWDVTGTATEVVGTFTNSTGLISVNAGALSTGTILFVPTAEQQISSSKKYELRGTVSGASADGDFVTVTIANDSTAIVALDSRNDIQTADSDAPIIWSDLSATSHSTSTDDWTSDFGVNSGTVSNSLNW